MPIAATIVVAAVAVQHVGAAAAVDGVVAVVAVDEVVAEPAGDGVVAGERVDDLAGIAGGVGVGIRRQVLTGAGIAGGDGEQEDRSETLSVPSVAVTLSSIGPTKSRGGVPVKVRRAGVEG